MPLPLMDSRSGDMKRGYRLFIVGLLAAILAATVLGAPVARATMNPPTWTVGDYWIYDLQGAAPIPDFQGTGEMRMDVVAIDTLDVGGGSFSAYRLRLNITVTTVEGNTTITVSFTGDSWFRTADLALAKMTLSGSFLIFVFTSTMTYNPPVAIQWPLDTGRAWSSTSTQTTVVTVGSVTQTTTNSVTNQFSVLTGQTVVVPRGSFATLPLRQSEGTDGYSIGYWSDTAGNYVRQETYDGLGTLQGSSDLLTYRYQGTGFFGTLVFGLSVFWWLVILGGILLAVVAVVMMRRRRPVAPAAVPPYETPYQMPYGPMPPMPPSPPTEPPGYPPQSPPGLP